VKRTEFIDGPACSGSALSVIRVKDAQIFFTPNSMMPISLLPLFSQFASANPQLSALSPRPSLQDLLDCSMNFLARSFDPWPQTCVNLLYARKIA
jgi:hypothetical protein